MIRSAQRPALLLSIFLVAAPALAQSPVPEPREASASLNPTFTSSLTPEFLESKIEETTNAPDLDPAITEKLTEQYRKALTSLQTAVALQQKTAAFKQSIETAPVKASTIREQLAARAREVRQAQDVLDGASLVELEKQLAQAKAEASALQAKLAEMDKELKDSSGRPAEARRAIDRAKSDLEKLDTEMGLPAPAGQAAALTEARGWAQEARQQALRAEILMLDQELLSQGVRIELLKASRDMATFDLERLKSTEVEIENRLAELFKAQAEKAAGEARKAQDRAAGKHPAVQALAQSNGALSEELTELTAELDRLAGMQEDIEQQTVGLERDFGNARQRIEAAGLTQALGQILFDRRHQFPDLGAYRKAASEREKAISTATLQQIRLAEEKDALRDPSDYADSLLPEEISGSQRDVLVEEMKLLAEQRATLIAQTLHTNDAYLRILGQIDYAASELIQVTEQYDAFLDERLLWVRSAQPVNLATFVDLPGALLWIFDPSNWLEATRVLLHEAGRSLMLWILLLVVAVLRWKASAMRQQIRATAEHLRRIRTDRLRYTLQALALTVLVAAPLPLLLILVGWTLSRSLESTPFAVAIGEAALSVSLGLFYLRSFLVLCMPDGVSKRHFRWDSDTLLLLRRNFHWLIAVLVPLGFLAVAAYNSPEPAHSSSLGRLSLMLLMVGLSVFAARVLEPEQGALKHWIAKHPKGLTSRLRKLWYPLLIAIPLALSALSAVGYMYTANVLLRALIGSMYLFLGLTVTHQFIMRWLKLTRRRLDLQAVLDRRAARALVQSEDVEQSAGASSVAEEEVPDFDELDERTRKLVNTFLFIGGALALWAIWAPVLPALGVFDQIDLWYYTSKVGGEERVVPATLADVGGAIVLILLTVVAVKNLPALLEILLLSRMSLSSGNRYAITTLTTYVITAVAGLFIFTTLGLSWGNVQWLVAALGVGIGFGLQEIVANFISGIIILFERPVRVGDVVTVGDTSGTVSKIRIRATTIRNWDQQELLVPNKEFITGRLLNWTLSDNLNRIVITVGIDYGADVPRALKLLEEAAREHEGVVEEPAPIITFEGFGDNALNLVLRCYLNSLDRRLVTVSELHKSINEKFRAAGISIAFPQRDVHLRAPEPIEVRVHRDPPTDENPKT